MMNGAFTRAGAHCCRHRWLETAENNEGACALSKYTPIYNPEMAVCLLHEVAERAVSELYASD